MTLQVTPEPFDSDVAAGLLAALDAELDERYPDEFVPAPVHDPADYRPPRGRFVVGRLDGVPVACGGVKPGPVPGTGEVKRMYVARSARGQRLAEQVLAALQVAARELGHERLVLETGVAQPEAIRLYERLGWRPVPGFGHYRESPLSRCYGLDLA